MDAATRDIGMQSSLTTQHGLLPVLVPLRVQVTLEVGLREAPVLNLGLQLGLQKRFEASTHGKGRIFIPL